MKRIAELIKSTRLEQRLSLGELALLLDVPEEKLVAFEGDGSGLEVETLFGLVNALNIEPEDFLNLLTRDELGLRVRAKLRS